VPGVRRSRSAAISSSVAEAHHAQAEILAARLSRNHPPNEIALSIPEMQRAARVLRGERVLCLAQIEQRLTVFQHNRSRRSAQKRFQHAGKLLRSLRLKNSAGRHGQQHSRSSARAKLMF
jgi:hypothetical protein